MSPWVLIFIGGGLGSLCRWVLGQWLGTHLGGPWWGTLGVNLLGCLFMGSIWACVDRYAATSPTLPSPTLQWVAPLVMVGFLGGFTTLSGLHKDVWQLIQAQAWGPLLLYSGLSSVGGLLCLMLGRRLL